MEDLGGYAEMDFGGAVGGPRARDASARSGGYRKSARTMIALSTKFLQNDHAV